MNAAIQIDVGGSIRKMRRDRGLTQQNLADLLGVDRTRISKIETNKLQIKTLEYMQIAYMLTAQKIGSFTVDLGEKGGVMTR